MPDQNELDDILNEIKNFNNNNNEDNEKEKSEPEFTLQEPEDENTDEDKAEPAFVDLSTFEKAKPEPKPEKLTDKGDKPQQKDKKKPLIIIGIALAVIGIIICLIVAIVNPGSKKEEPSSTTAPSSTTQATEPAAVPAEFDETNPLTGIKNMKGKAIGKRPVACVVENAEAARPQWGIDDEKNPPDIILEGEVEGGETRMLWFYADYRSLPDKIGPMRSARPPYIKFSELFDAIFIHWGMSKTKIGTPYIGANTVFKEDNVAHINQMTYSGSVPLFGRDNTRSTAIEHRGILYGDKLKDAILETGYRRHANAESYTRLKFASKVTLPEAAASVDLKFSSRTATRSWTYNAEDGYYHCGDYKTDVVRKNLLILFDGTEYIAKEGYKGMYTEVYCNYNLEGGKGKLCTNGTAVDVVWSVENGLLVLRDKDGNDITLNKGTSWFGYASSNNGGALTIK